MSTPSPRHRGERGTATAFVVGMAVTLLAVAGLVVDGGNALNERMRLADNTEQAARAGAQEIDLVALRGTPGVLRLDRGAAEARASEFIGRFQYTNQGIVVTDDEVTVAASDTVETKLLSLIGFDEFDISATATAEAVTQ